MTTSLKEENIKKFDRYFFHPVGRNKRSLSIVLFYLFLNLIIGGWVWWRFKNLFDGLGLDLPFFYSLQNPFLSVFISPHFRASLIIISALLGGTWTAYRVIGPTKRIAGWLEGWNEGKKMGRLKIREGKMFSHLVHLMNEISDRWEKPT